MSNCNTTVTPASTTPLGLDKDRTLFKEDWEYAEIMGMLILLGTNSCPDIAYAVHQCAWFTHCPRVSHATAVQRIICYLKVTKDKGLILTPSSKLKIDCYVNLNIGPFSINGWPCSSVSCSTLSITLSLIGNSTQ